MQKQFSNDPIFVDALLKIIGAVNRGIQKHDNEIRIQQDIIQDGRSIIEYFMTFSVGQEVKNDTYTLDFIFSFLWVLKSDSTVLVNVMRYLMNLINSAPTFYKSNLTSSLMTSGNQESQALISKNASFHLQKICYYYGKNLLTQYTEFLTAIESLLSGCSFNATISNLSVCYCTSSSSS